MPRGLTTGSLVAHPTWLYCVDNTDVYAMLPGLHAVLWERGPGSGVIPSASATRSTPPPSSPACGKRAERFAAGWSSSRAEVEYRNQHGQLVATAASEVLRTPRDSAKAMDKYGDLDRSNYSASDIQGIYQAYDDEYIRGELPRYWEDQPDKEDLPPIVRGPLTTEEHQFVRSVHAGYPGLPLVPRA